MTVSPKKSLGQHFLVDRNILEVIGRLSELDRADVVLEIGPGSGVLTVYLADRVRHVHAVEVDRSLEEPLLGALGSHANVELHWGDALELDVATVDPLPTKLVANLPYNVATPIVIETLEHAPSLVRWCVMVQREIADRFFAVPRSKSYGAVSVLVQLCARRVGYHPVSPAVFRPRPNVDSALVAFVRTSVDGGFGARPVIEAAFAHRRKTVSNSIALTGYATRPRTEAALVAIGRSERARAEELEPAEFVALAHELR
jgi:16S rRNA (adenine1518-N6/adenine1519-N6)-dimethyltransferase